MAPIDEVRLRLERFTTALAALERLTDSAQAAAADVLRDARIQRFEFSFEAGWKLLQAVARLEGLETGSPRRALDTARRLALVDEDTDEALAGMLRYRNLTVHTYDEALAREVERFILDVALPVLRVIATRTGALYDE